MNTLDIPALEHPVIEDVKDPSKTKLVDIDILLTLPHAYCIVSEVRMCDTLALAAGSQLENDFIKSGFSVLKFVATIPRTKKDDLNRLQGETKSFRPDLSKWLVLHRTHLTPRWFADIHSFPSGPSPDSARPGEAGAWNDEYANVADLVILDNYPESYHPLHILLRDFLLEQKFTVAILEGALEVNDINREEIKDLSGVDSSTLVSLLEFNESLASDVLTRLCEGIVKFWTLYKDTLTTYKQNTNYTL